MTADPTPLARLYEFMRVMSEEERLEFARWTAEKPALFNQWSRRSIKFYGDTFSNADEAFHPPRPELPAPASVTDIATGRDLTILLADQPRGRWWEVEDAPELAFRFLDELLVRSRKVISRPLRRRIDLRAYLDEVLTSLAPMWRKTHHQVTVSCPPGVVLDTYPGAIYQIIVNLLTNSLVHGFDGIDKGSVVIEVSVEAAMASIVYRDNGRGMSEDVRRRMFEPFFTTRRGHGGSGLGMHIVYNLATQLLRGSISCDSAPGQGIKVVMKIPI